MRSQFAAVGVLLLSLLALGIPAAAAPLTGSAWCQDHASLAVLGDSGSTGLGTTGYASQDDSYFRTAYGWYKRATDEAKSNYGTASANYAHNGAMAADFLPGGRWPLTTGALVQIEQTKPSLAIIELGGNEYLSAQGPDAFRTNLTELVTRIQTASPRTAVLLVAIWDIAAPGAALPWSQYVGAIRDTAIARGVAMVDLRQYIPRADLDRAGLYNPDRTHLNDAGNMVFAAAAWTWLLSC